MKKPSFLNSLFILLFSLLVWLALLSGIGFFITYFMQLLGVWT